MKDKTPALWAPSTNLRREITTQDLAGGYPCGPLDMPLFNELAYRLLEMNAEIANALTRFGVTPSESDLTQLGGIIAQAQGGELTFITKTAKQTLPAAATETDITWNVPTTAPSWASFNGTSLTVTQKCRVMSFLSVVAAVSNSAAGYSESDIHLALNGTDIEGTGQSAWPNTNTTFIPYLKLTSILDLNVGDVLRSRAVVNSANYNGGYLLGTDGSYGVTEQSTNWRLLCLRKG